jgi:hypothetical protein
MVVEMTTQHFRHPKGKQNPLIDPVGRKLVSLGMVAGLALILGMGEFVGIKSAVAQKTPVAARRDPVLDPPIVQRLEKTLGKPLTPEQRQQVVKVATQTGRQMLAAQERIADRIADITGLALPDVRSILPSVNEPLILNRQFLERLTQAMGNTLTTEQRQTLDLAARRRQQALFPIREQFAYQVAQITGLPVVRVKQLLAQRTANSPQASELVIEPAATPDNALRPSRGSAADISGTSSRSDTEILSR